MTDENSIDNKRVIVIFVIILYSNISTSIKYLFQFIMQLREWHGHT